jgi:glycine/D-amino acid oxidase-like deaminating enzyme/nitrite reductase/ring-hydroxylating ferredoxin subunit
MQANGKLSMDTTSFWRKTVKLPESEEQSGNYSVDVVVIGAGITGITTAYLLKKSGCRVALLERGSLGGFDTSNTSAHVTCVTDSRIHKLAKDFGKDTARAVWDAGRAAIDRIFENIRNEGIQCEFQWVPAYHHSSGSVDPEQERKKLNLDCHTANELGFPADFVASVPLYNAPGVRYAHQAIFHPLQYVGGLLQAIPGDGSYVFDNTESTEVVDEPLLVKTKGGNISCEFVVLATHNPLIGKSSLATATLFQTKLFLYTSYVIGAKIPPGVAPVACFWDTADPYSYLRVHRRGEIDYAILGGEDHKTGQNPEPSMAHERLEAELKRVIPSAQPDSRWSGQVIETPDGLPYIGEITDRQFVATGFAGNGMTFGTLGGMMAADAFLMRKNPWQEIFSVDRKVLKRGAWDYVKENKDYPYYMLRDWLGEGEGKSLEEVRQRQGKILHLDGKKVAAYRDEKGKLSLCSAICTHLKCIVAWNEAEKTWDCPCHGSRFSTAGEVLSGPAEEPLDRLDISAEKVVEHSA